MVWKHTCLEKHNYNTRLKWRAENPETMKARSASRRWYETNKERLASSRKNNREQLNKESLAKAS